jgi:uncharacterized membrane protein YdjX (TVP38/TMEM64 family)
MKTIMIQVAVFAAFFLLLFGLTFNLPFASGAETLLHENSITGALISVLMLASDIVLPIPSSVVMLLNGKLFGIVPGMLISTAGLVLSTFAGYFIGKTMNGRIPRFLAGSEQAHSEKVFKKWGYLALIITRPVPLLSESFSIVAGIQGVSPAVLIVSAIAGSLPGAFVYAYYGSLSNEVQSQYISFLLVISIAVLAFITAKLFTYKSKQTNI